MKLLSFLGASIYVNSLGDRLNKGERRMAKGIVKCWISDRGCGFITSEGVEKDILVRSSNLKGTIYLEEGEKVKFKILNTTRGLMAVNVESLNF
ncbi:MAG: cold shock domain-containing protein [Candidatus Bathyarchaeota archaeon]